MDIKINVIEVACALAKRELFLRENEAIVEFGTDYLAHSPFPNGILVEDEEGNTSYTDEAQDYFNNQYDLWWDFLYDQKIGEDE